MPFGTLIAVSDEALSAAPTWHFTYLATFVPDTESGEWGLLFRFIPTGRPDMATEFGFKGTWSTFADDNGAASSIETYSGSYTSIVAENLRIIPGTPDQYADMEIYHTQIASGDSYSSSINAMAPGTLGPHVGVDLNVGTLWSSSASELVVVSRLGPGVFELYELGGGILNSVAAQITFEESAPTGFWTGFTNCTEIPT